MNAATETQDQELRAHEDHHASLRLWLRLLSCTTLIEETIRQKLREKFDITLSRFDLMAQLERHREGLTMGELSRRMMVTGGNITPVTDQLVKEGWVERMELPHDRRAWLVRLTPAGRSLFKKMAKRHEAWIVAAFSSLSQRDVHQLHELLGQVKQHSLSSTLENP